ncbi:collagen-like triple helix repeat-containing protein [Wolbachia endosymbiont of Ceratitis capitata]|uniref:collagen-like triple helix repeat-containing protein n=1 Tax=Wolbachia endosymbiont of Ceratitis capitata TaxID=323653 RepID=UPI001BD3FD15|nr:collagen-like protein [Wolbachia endosymbiont of Ceratitis capitata]MBS9529594.1 collagen-like protein [Wolbachia endosymbiont of Ceratitis capitata]
MTLDEPLEESLINNNDFVNALLAKLKAGADDNGVYTKKGVDDELKKKADTAALTNKADKNYVDTELRKKANSANLAAKANTADVYTKKNVDDELAKKADTAALANKADKNYVDTELGKKANTADVYTKTAADTAFAKINASNLIEAVNKKAFAKAILPAKDGDKSILVDKLGEFLDNSTDNKYGAKSDQTAKVFLGGKGLKGDQGNTGPKGEKGDTGLKGADGAQGPKGDKGDTGLKGEKGDTGLKGADGTSPSADEIAAEKALQEHVTKISIESPEFKRAVQEEMSQPYFEPPTSDDAALNWTW